MLPDNKLEAQKGLHVEDIDCKLTVRPTRTALDLTFFEEVGGGDLLIVCFRCRDIWLDDRLDALDVGGQSFGASP